MQQDRLKFFHSGPQINTGKGNGGLFDPFDPEAEEKLPELADE
jgi:hypothetical protein